MSARSPPLPSRATTLLVVVAVHALVLWLLLRPPAPPAAEVETFVSEMILFSAPARNGARHPQAPAAGRAPRAAADHTRSGAQRPSPAAPLQLLPLPQPSDAITLPSVPGTSVDWFAQLGDAADTELDHERRAARQLGALTRKFHVGEDPRNPRPDPRSGFRWYDAGIHRIDTRGPLPVLHVNAHCLLVAFIMPICAIGHIDIHDDLFNQGAAWHDEGLATAPSNDAP